MGVSVRALARGAAAAVVLVSCNVPTDKSKEIQVLVRPSEGLAARGIVATGSTDSLFAFAYRITASGDTERLPNVELRWSSGDPTIAFVAGSANGVGLVTGINSGYARIFARAIAFDQAAPGDTLIRIASSFAIDSVRPVTVRYGAKLDVYGVGIHTPAFWLLGDGGLIEDPFAFTGVLTGLETREFWVPWPATSGHVVYVGGGLADSTDEAITVDPRDIFEPDTLDPGVIDVNGPGVLHQGVAPLPVLYFNPALAFEPVTSGSDNIDWVRLDQSDAAPVSVLVGSQVSGDTAFAFVSDSLFKCGLGADAICYNPPSGWYFTAGLQACTGGRSFSYPTQPRVPTFVVAFRQSPAHRLHLVQFYSREGRYELLVLRGYLRGRSIPPDRFEDNTMCFQADSNFDDSTGTAKRQIVVGPAPPFGAGPFGDSLLTISTPYDVDMYRFRVTAVFATDTLVTIATRSRLQGAVDPSDIDVYVYDQSGAPLATSTAVGSTEQVTLRAPPGEYYVAVVDVAGQPTVYAMCIAKGTACTPPGSTAPALVTAKAHTWVRAAATAPAGGAVTSSDPRRLFPRP